MSPYSVGRYWLIQQTRHSKDCAQVSTILSAYNIGISGSKAIVKQKPCVSHPKRLTHRTQKKPKRSLGLAELEALIVSKLDGYDSDAKPYEQEDELVADGRGTYDEPIELQDVKSLSARMVTRSSGKVSKGIIEAADKTTACKKEEAGVDVAKHAAKLALEDGIKPAGKTTACKKEEAGSDVAKVASEDGIKPAGKMTACKKAEAGSDVAKVASEDGIKPAGKTTACKKAEAGSDVAKVASEDEEDEFSRAFGVFSTK